MMSVYPRQKMQELMGLLCLASSLLLFLALISYSARDPSFSVAAPATAYANWVGRIGALAADLLFQWWGFAALVLPAPIVLMGYHTLRGRPVEFLPVKISGFIVALLAIGALLTLLGIEAPQWANFTAGGLFGMVIAHALEAYLNQIGALILVATLLLGAVLITTRFSLEAALGLLVERDWNVAGWWSTRRQRWSQQRARKRELAQLKNAREALVTEETPRRIELDRPAASTPAEATAEAAPPTAAPTVAAPVLNKPQKQEPAGADWNPARTIRPDRKQSWQLPSLDFLQEPLEEIEVNEEELIERARQLSLKCAEFGATGRVLQIHPGPVVTTFEFKPDPGVKYSRITNLADDLCLALKAESVRIDRIPGKNTVGIEVPNSNRRTILLREIVGSAAFQQSKSVLTLGMGQLINGSTSVTDLAKMPHLLIAGSTGAGKSVGLNCMVCSILFKASPDDVRFIMVDPKRLELGVYEGIPHLLTPIVTEPKKAANALNWAVREMEERYKLLARKGVRNISQFNRLVEEGGGTVVDDDEEPLEKLPFIVVIVDELADLMLLAGKEVETALTRLAQMARAVGIHLILATQRPSVDVITGLIKANFPSRVSYRVSSKVDSRTILDANGGEQLLGMGDMLFLSPSTARLTRIHGAYASEKEIAAITDSLKNQGAPAYREEILESDEESEGGSLVEAGELQDALYQEAAEFVVETRKASTSLLQRRFRIGYGRAARLLDMLEHEGIVGPPDGSKPRQILVPPDYFSELEQ